MSRSLNKVMLIGNVGKDPDLKYTSSGIPVTTFRLATTEKWKNRDGETKEHTEWHTIVAWRGLAEIMQRMVKRGSKVYIEGKLQSRTFEDKNGFKKNVYEILADNMLMLEPPRQKAAEEAPNINNFTNDKIMSLEFNITGKDESVTTLYNNPDKGDGFKF